MSGFVGLFTTRVTELSIADAMLASGSSRGELGQSEVRRERGSFLGISRFEWELAGDFSGPVLLVEDGELTIAADATLYYRDDLRKKLEGRGVTPQGDTPSHLILAAYRAWGTECALQLEGDFAFVIWNRASGDVFCARDFTGRRPLYFAEWGGTLAVASTIGAILAHPACPRQYNVAEIAAMATGLDWSLGVESCYRAIQVVPPASQFVASQDRRVRLSTYWKPFVRTEDPNQSFESAAEELRALLERSTVERMGSEGTTSIWMSGGWDSTAIFGAGRAALAAAGSTRQLLPVSISYPIGDPGREDELINDVANFWKAPIHWLDIDRIPLYAETETRAANAEHPPAHMYDPWNRALARGSRALGTRIALDGNGGDQLFQVGDIFMSDLLKRGHLLEFAKEWKHKRPRGLRRLARMSIEPLLPAPLARLASRVTRSEGRHYLARVLPSWARRDFVQKHQLEERDLAWLPSGSFWSRADAEMRTLVAAPGVCNVLGYMAGELLSEGVETRSPLIDRRIVEFALRRPTSDRVFRHETKRLLRRAVRGTLPDNLLEPRPFRTGVTTGYSVREMRKHLPALLEGVLQSPMALAELGIIDQAALQRAFDRFRKGQMDERVNLYRTLNMELWLRGRRTQMMGESYNRTAVAIA